MTPQRSRQRILSKVRSDLLSVGVLDNEHIEVFSTKTRDKPTLTVYRDVVTKVIFIDDYYIGDDEYITGAYRDIPNKNADSVNRDYEDLLDSERRFLAYKQFFTAKNICDFGCGAGSFLRKAKSVANRVCGIELQNNFVEVLNKDNIPCHDSLSSTSLSLDVITFFHCFEHLPNPLESLKGFHDRLAQNGGKLIIEAPHARDFLIDTLRVQEFIDFTLWSQDLILHTRESLNALLVAAGFRSIVIEGIQRYGLSNHLRWLTDGRPGGHKAHLSVLETNALSEAYASSLSKIDANDTLVAIATT